MATLSTVAPQTLQRRGAHRVWTTELPGRDAVLRAVHIGAATSTVRLGTGIAYAPTRHPVLVASSAHEANLATGGRFTLGNGTGATPLREAIGAEFDHPAARLAEYIALVKATLTARDGLEFTGRFCNVSLPELRLGTIGEPPKVIASGLNPAALKAVARTADGIALHPLALLQPYLDDVVLPAVAAGQGPATPNCSPGASPRSTTTAPSPGSAPGPDWRCTSRTRVSPDCSSATAGNRRASASGPPPGPATVRTGVTYPDSCRTTCSTSWRSRARRTRCATS